VRQPWLTWYALKILAFQENFFFEAPAQSLRTQQAALDTQSEATMPNVIHVTQNTFVLREVFLRKPSSIITQDPIDCPGHAKWGNHDLRDMSLKYFLFKRSLSLKPQLIHWGPNRLPWTRTVRKPLLTWHVLKFFKFPFGGSLSLHWLCLGPLPTYLC